MLPAEPRARQVKQRGPACGNPERLHENATLYLQARGKGPADRRQLAVPAGNMFRDELELFADSIQLNAACELSAANGCLALAAVYAALKSAAEGSRFVALSEIVATAERELIRAQDMKQRGVAGIR